MCLSGSGSDEMLLWAFFFFQAEDGIRDRNVTGVQTCALPIFIAESMLEMSRLPTPIICVVIGEGGSGGALGIGVGDRVAVLQYAYYSVISPEGCAGILWKSHDFASDAARALKLTSKYLQELGCVDDVIEEPLGAAHRDHHQMATRLKMY